MASINQPVVISLFHLWLSYFQALDGFAKTIDRLYLYGNFLWEFGKQLDTSVLIHTPCRI